MRGFDTVLCRLLSGLGVPVWACMTLQCARPFWLDADGLAQTLGHSIGCNQFQADQHGVTQQLHILKLVFVLQSRP